jgi:hypothetical protein
MTVRLQFFEEVVGQSVHRGQTEGDAMSLRICATLTAAFAVTVSLAAGQEGVGQAPGTKTLSATGAVTSVSTRSLVIEGTGKRSLTFTLDSGTRVLSRGRARLLPPAPRRPEISSAIPDFVHSGDRVTVRFQVSGTVLKAIEIRVLAK